MLNLVDWKEFFDNARSNKSKPYIAQVNRYEDMIGWALFADGEQKNVLCNNDAVKVWKSLDDMIGAIYEQYDLYFDVHVYYAGERQVDLNDKIVIDFNYGAMAVNSQLQ